MSSPTPTLCFFCLIEESDSLHRSHTNSKPNQHHHHHHHPTILSGDVTPANAGPPPLILPSDTDLTTNNSTNVDINDDGNISDTTVNSVDIESFTDRGPTPLVCDRGE